ncbi:Tn3 family transposase [Escherichia coli]|uniref:Tn3 family transposase n=1 Tax=Escherichia coli TaxID=562 RepID=UPI00388F022B
MPSAEAETITSANARLVDFRQRCHWHRYGVEEVASADGMRLLRQSEQSRPDRTANTLVITERITQHNFVSGSVFRLSWHRYTGTLRDSIFVLEGLLEQEHGLNQPKL